MAGGPPARNSGAVSAPCEVGTWGRAGQVVAPVWLTVVAWLYLSACFCCAGIIAYDIAFNRRRQPMGVMNFVFPITALYFGPFALALYWRWGRADAQTTMASMSMSQAAVSRTAVATTVGGLQLRDGLYSHHEMAGAAGQDGADGPAPPDERRPWWVTMAIEGEPLRLWLHAGRRTLRARDIRAGPHDRWPYPGS